MSHESLSTSEFTYGTSFFQGLFKRFSGFVDVSPANKDQAIQAGNLECPNPSATKKRLRNSWSRDKVIGLGIHMYVCTLYMYVYCSRLWGMYIYIMLYIYHTYIYTHTHTVWPRYFHLQVDNAWTNIYIQHSSAQLENDLQIPNIFQPLSQRCIKYWASIGYFESGSRRGGRSCRDLSLFANFKERRTLRIPKFCWGADPLPDSMIQLKLYSLTKIEFVNTAVNAKG